MKTGSLRLRLAAGGAAAIFLALLLAGVGLVYLFERHVMRSLVDDLETELRQALATIEVDLGGRPFLRREPSDPRFAEPLSGLYWQASTSAGGMARSRSLWDVTLSLPNDVLALGEAHQHRISGPGGSELIAVERTVQLRFEEKPAQVRVTIAADIARIAAARRSFTADLAPALGLLGLVLAAAMWVQIGLGLKPLERLRDSIGAIRRGERTRLAGPAPKEVAPLVEGINDLLVSQEKDIERARRRAADLAHGLKTPLAALAVDVRVLIENGEDELAANIANVGETMRRHVERELARARIRGLPERGAAPTTPLRPLAEALIAMQSRTAEGSRLAFENMLEGDPVIAMDKADLAEVLGNLLENAARHARSRVRVGLLQDDRVSIEDDGPGIPENLRAPVLARGERLDHQGEGVGQGIAIVQDVLEAYGRRLRLKTSELGGLAVSF